MKTLGRIVAVVGVLAIVGSGVASQAGPLYFSTTSGYTTWDNATTPAWGGSGGPYNLIWSAASDAHFEGLAGSVTVTGAIGSVNSIIFDVGGYTLSGNTSTITLSGSAVVGIAAGTATISTSLAGSVALNKTGNGTLTLTYPQSNGLGLYGPVTVSGGTLLLGGGANLLSPASSITVQNGATLSDNGASDGQNIQLLTLDNGTLAGGSYAWNFNQDVTVPDGPNTSTISGNFSVN
jgi:fibronectin-binding autotransporter adhesin